MSKSFKKLVAIVSAIAMVIAGITVQPQTANAAEALEWSELTDGLGKATIKDTSTEEVRGAEYKGFETDRSWGGDSKWQGQAKVNDVTVEAGQAYKVSLDVSSTPAKKILVQTLSGGEYVEKEYDTTVGHIEQTFVANNDKVNIIVAFGSFSDDEVGTYDVSISNLKLEKTEKSEEQIEKERVEALLTGDKNIAKGKKAFSNSVKEKDYQPEEAFDGNLGSRYAAASYESGVTLGVDLGKTYKVSSVAFKWENAYATEYNIQVSKDGKAYDTVKTMTADKAETIEVPLDEAVEARYVRIECVKNALNYGYSIWEMGVYGTEVAEVETTTPVVEPGTGETTTPAKQDETTTSAKQDETTTPAKQDETTTSAKQNETTTVAPTTKAISTTAAPAKVKKTTVKATAKKLSSNKVKLSVKKVAGASKYAVQISTTKKFKKVVAKKTSKKAVFTVKSKKLKGKKKLYVRVKVYKKVNGKTVASQWSKATKIRLKK